MTSFIRDLGPSLAADFAVCAITPGEKRPVGKAWLDNPLTPSQCASFSPHEAGVGIICGREDKTVYALDFDIEGDVEFSREMRSELCALLAVAEDDLVYRVGNPPKFLVPVTGEPGRMKATSPWFEKDGMRSRLEFLGKGQQFVAFAIHPATEQPYEWYGNPTVGEYIDIPPMLPEVSDELLAEILATFEEVAVRHGWVRAGMGKTAIGGDGGITADELVPQYPMGISIDEARLWLTDFGDVDDYDTWLHVGMALHHEFAKTEKADEALLLWDEWSQSGKEYKGLTDLRNRWDGFGETHVGKMKTMRWVRREYQTKHYDKANEPTDAGRAARMADYYRGRLLVTTEGRQWYRWDGLHWRVLYPVAIDTLAKYVCDDLLRADIEAMDKDSREPFAKLYNRLQTGQKVHDVVVAASLCEELQVPANQFDRDPRWFGVANGDLDLETLTFTSPAPSHYVSRATTVSYDPEAKCPIWEQTVLDVFSGDRDMADYFQRVAGYIMLGEPVEEVMFVLHGNGCNGKSTVINTLRAVFGAYACSISSDMMTAVGRQVSGSGGPRADIVGMFGKRLVLVPETDQGARLKEAFVKRLVSTDEVVARGLYEREMRAERPTWVPIMATNYLPRIDGDDEGIWRRIHAIGFNRNFNTDPTVKKDLHRAKKLRAEYPGILNWCLEGIRKYRESGINPPSAVENESKQYRQSMDYLNEWIEDRAIISPRYATPVAAVWASWEGYARLNGLDHVIKSKQALTARLSRKGIKPVVRRYDGKASRVYEGIGLVDDNALE